MASGPATAAIPSLGPPHPRHDRAVVEPDHELGAHRDFPADALDQTHDVRIEAARGHAVGEAHDAGCGLELGFEHQRAVAVPPSRLLHRLARRDQPAAVLGRAEQGGKAGPRIETGQTEPVDGAVASDERDSLGVADECVIFQT